MSQKKTSQKAREISGAELDQALKSVLRDSMPLMAIVFCGLFALFTISHALLLTGKTRVIMVSLAGVTALVFLVTFAVLRRSRLMLRCAYPLTFALTLLVLANSLLHLYLTDDPLHTTNLLLLVVGVGFLFLYTRWWGTLIALILLGWGVGALRSQSGGNWLHFGFALVSASVLSLVVHVMRLRNFRRMQTLRVRDEQQQTTLETTLATAQRMQRALETTLGVGQQMTSILDPESLLHQVAEVIKTRYGFDYVGVFLVDEADEDYVIARAGTGEAGRLMVVRRTRLRIGQKGESEGIIGWVAKHVRSAQVNDVSQDTRYIPALEMPETRSELALPLVVSGKLLGVLDIQSQGLAAFKDEDALMLKSLADLVASAIRNASLYQLERSQRLLAEKLYNVGRALSRTLDLAEVLDLILKQLADLVPYDRGSVMMERASEELPDVRPELVFFAARGFPMSVQLLNMSIPIKENDVYDEIRRTQQPLLLPEVQLRPDWEYVTNLPPARSWLGVPLISSDQVIGMLSLARERPDPYTEDEVALSAMFAGQAAVALQNARLYDNIQQINRQLEMTVDELQERSQELQLAYAQLERLDRTKSDFIAVASHELRTPLTVLSGYSQILLQDAYIAGNAYLSEMVKGIKTGAERLHKIMDSMLDMAKIDSRELQLHPEPVDLFLLLQSVRRMMEEILLQRDLTIHIDALKELPWVQADPDALRKVFYHLLNNAVKYTPNGREIFVTGRALDPWVHNFPEGGVEVVVRDTGIGIDASLHDLIFAKFYQSGEVALHSTGDTKFKGGGPGLGLAIARGIVEAHGGRIWVESPGYDETTCPGSSFFVVLPVTPKVLLREE